MEASLLIKPWVCLCASSSEINSVDFRLSVQTFHSAVKETGPLLHACVCVRAWNHPEVHGKLPAFLCLLCKNFGWPMLAVRPWGAPTVAGLPCSCWRSRCVHAKHVYNIRSLCASNLLKSPPCAPSKWNVHLRRLLYLPRNLYFSSGNYPGLPWWCIHQAQNKPVIFLPSDD